MRKCPSCANDNQDNAVVCTHCGRDVPIVPAPQAVTRRRVWPWIGGAALVCGLWSVVALRPHGSDSILDGLRALPEAKRAELLGSLVTSSDPSRQCGAVSRVFEMGYDTTNGMSSGSVACEHGNYMISIENFGKGSGRVLSCAAYEMGSRHRCFERIEK